ncbi:MAG TPA: ATP-dependent DNA helicase RecG [Mariprofundaceae bacterium]|nr:ATP-dependent DNA helicase RecG [Mariprofundaceae bacterium]
MSSPIYSVLMLPVSQISGIGAAVEKKLHTRGIARVGDLLLNLPKDYIDDRIVSPIASLQAGTVARIQGAIVRKSARGFGRKRQISIVLADQSGEILLHFFHSGYMMTDARLSEGRSISVRGVPEHWQGHWQMAHPDWQIAEHFTPGFRPVYGSLAGLSGKRVTNAMLQALRLLPASAVSPLDELICSQQLFGDIPSFAEALRCIHAPQTSDMTPIQQASFRLKSEEILVYLHLMRQKRRRADCPAPVINNVELSEKLLDSLPYPLTDAQKAAWQDISVDLASGRRMHRLLQGDVGAGKTWVAALCMAKAADQGLQAALLAPTEVLANQHEQTLASLLSPLGLSVGLLTGSTRAAERRQMLGQLQDGELRLLVGTHALLSDDVVFDRLGLALVDEQHRFGVRQRWALTEKGRGDDGVHLLGMTATPIPRSLALALYGDMDLSLMHGMPPGRKPVETRVLAASRMKALADGMRRILDDGGRIYWIVPRIDEDDDGISVDQRAELLVAYFPDAGVQGLHGRMKASDKQGVLDAFTYGECRILVSTTVVEVGVNVTSARLIVIEQAELYGLAQLHQLRGRVGRSDEQGYCILVAGDGISETATQRLRHMERSHDGLELAEADLQLRGAGDAVGTRQSGEAGFRLLDMVADAAIIREWHEHLPEFSPDEDIQRFWRPNAEAVD